MSIYQYATPDDLSTLSGAVEAHCRRHNLDGEDRADVAAYVYHLYSEGVIDQEVIADRLDHWQRERGH